MKREVAIVGYAQQPNVRRSALNDVEMLNDVVTRAAAMAGLDHQKDIGFVCLGSADYLTGVPFSFIRATDCYPTWPPMRESHVEMDGAWALYEAVMRLQHGDIDTAMVYAFGKSSLGEIVDVLTLQLDPYYMTPLGPDAVSLAALQANAYLERSGRTEADLAEVAARSRRDALANEHAQLRWDRPADELLKEPYVNFPLRRHDLPPVTDGAAAIVLAVGDRARGLAERPAWIRGIDHRIEPHLLGARDITTSPSTAAAARGAGVDVSRVDVAELHAPFTHQELILRDALQLGNGTRINPSGGALAANPVMSAGLIRFIEAARAVMEGSADCAIAHATSGPCLQQNMVAVIEGEQR